MKEAFCQKQRNNPHYSLRAYARDIGLHPGSLSQIIQGKRPLPVKEATNVVEKLRLSAEERTRFMESLLRRKATIDDIKINPADNRFMLDETYFKVISEWEHYAVLELFDCKDFELNTEEVSKRLEVTLLRAEDVLKNLQDCGLLIENNEGKLVKAYPDIKTSEDVASEALKESHKETLLMGVHKLEEIAVELRDFSSSTLAIDLEKIPQAKIIIREFRQKMAALMKDGEKTDVYQLAVQFYPLTKSNQDQEQI